MRNLILHKVRQNNLKEVDLEIPLGKSVVVTGPSGSGKSSLAFETIYAEGQRRYMQSLSTYARQFLEKFRAPDVDKIENIPPTIALEQVNPVRNSRATVGTTTELYDYLRLLFEKVGKEYCETCNVPMERPTFEEIFAKLKTNFSGQSIVLTFARHLPKEAENYTEYLKDLLRTGYSRLLFDGQTVTTEEAMNPPWSKKMANKKIAVAVDRIKIPEKAKEAESLQTRIVESLRNALDLGSGVAELFVEKDKKYSFVEDFTRDSRCPKCKKTSPPKSAVSFSFNNPLGACATCKGFGNILDVDEALAIPNPNLSVAQGAVDPFMKPSMNQWQKKLMAFCKENKIDVTLAYRELSEAHRKAIFEGNKKFKGVKGVFKMLEEERYKMRIRVFLSRYQAPFTCPDCHGARLANGPLRVRVTGENIAELCDYNFEMLQKFFKKIKLNDREKKIAADILRQIDRRLDYLNAVGLGYLTLSRLTRSLSGGEYQRILLSTQLSQGLTDTMYVLDEPSIGLHPKDTGQLIKVLDRLRALGNSLVIVEHDPEMIDWGEHIVDLGPGAGHRGGQILFSGSRERFLHSETSTALAVRDWKKSCREALLKAPLPEAKTWLEINGAQGNNLKNIDVKLPLQRLVAITGVSGSGKSTLIVDTLYQALAKIFHAQSERIAKFSAIRGFEYLGGIELVDQSSIGKSSRSNPVTFIKAYDEIRNCFAGTKEAIARHLTPGNFSFNIPGGRCETCEGEGRVRVDMVFMEDVWVPCQTCDEKRFKPQVLAVQYKGRNIDDVLRMTVDEAYDFFKAIPSLRAKLAILQEVGLGYVKLGQPGYTLSGGEAQRLKIARELSSSTLRKPRTLFIFDEPTTGLHFGEITRLISVLKRLIQAGHSVIVIEHNVQMICAADYIVDLGPDGGDRGGGVVAMGTPKELAQKKLPHTGLYLAEILS